MRKDGFFQLNLLKPAGNLTYHQVTHSIILLGDYLPSLCFVWFSEKNSTF